MPWPVTHLLISKKVFSKYFSHLDPEPFLIGTSFPDIRYPASINRGITHFKNLPLFEIQSADSFYAGLYFHCLVDHLWNIHLHQHNPVIFDQFPHNPPMIHTMKVLQDVYLYDRMADWQSICRSFDRILPEELQFGVSDKMVRLWHNTLASYLRKPPEITDLEMLQVSLPADMVERITQYYRIYHDHPVLRRIMQGFYEQIEPLITRFAAADSMG